MKSLKINPEGVSRPQAGVLTPATKGRGYEPRRGERASIFILSPLRGLCCVLPISRGYTPACGLDTPSGFYLRNFNNE